MWTRHSYFLFILLLVTNWYTCQQINNHHPQNHNNPNHNLTQNLPIEFTVKRNQETQLLWSPAPPPLQNPTSLTMNSEQTPSWNPPWSPTTNLVKPTKQNRFFFSWFIFRFVVTIVVVWCFFGGILGFFLEICSNQCFCFLNFVVWCFLNFVHHRLHTGGMRRIKGNGDR